MHARFPHDEEPVDPAGILRLGTIRSIDLSTGMVVVESGDVVTAPIRFSTGRAGATRHWSPPSVGEQLLLACPGGDIDGAIAIGAVPQAAFPPAGDSTREVIAFADGAQIAYDPATGRCDLALPAGGTVVVDAPGGVTVTAATGGVVVRGDVSIEGDLAVAGRIDARDEVAADGVALTNHKHLGVLAGGALSGVPFK